MSSPRLFAWLMHFVCLLLWLLLLVPALLGFLLIGERRPRYVAQTRHD